MTKKRRYLISAAILAACACITLGVLAMLPPKTSIVKADFDRIENGMTIAEVEAVLGSKGYHTGRAKNADWFVWYDKSRGDGWIIVVLFDENKAIQMNWTEPREAIPDKLRRWLHLRKPVTRTS